MGELSIKIKIANRVYPLTVKQEEEEGIRKAADSINKEINDFERLYAVKDKQDLLAMVALKIATTNFELENKGIVDDEDIRKSLETLSSKIDSYL